MITQKCVELANACRLLHQYVSATQNKKVPKD